MSFSTLSLRTGLLATVTAATLALGGCAMSPMGSSNDMSDNSARFGATLAAAAEVPPNGSTGSGMVDATLDKRSNVLSWRMVYSGLSGPATMAHFHGPAMPGTNAGVALPIPNAMSPAQGQATLTAAQVADLMAGKWYANVHTAANPGGEIRGQMMVK